jgi:hypothetical protein
MKRKTKKDKKFEGRQKFLDVYSEFNEYIESLGFRLGHYWKENTTAHDFHYSFYDKYIDSLFLFDRNLSFTRKLFNPLIT